MPKLPTARQNRLPSPQATDRAADRKSLAHAFRTFTRVAGSLEKSYAQLQSEVGRLRAELESANAELSRKVEENSQVRAFLTRVLEGLPCGVVVTTSRREPRMVNPEARRLLRLNSAWVAGETSECPSQLSALLSVASPNSHSCEQEWEFESSTGSRTIGISGAQVEESTNDQSQTIWIIRDISDQKRLAAEREAARRAHALAEIATVLAHEIRNPLASMELFTGLLADATTEIPETREWVTHLQAGLRLLSATVNNVLQFHSQPREELLPTNLDRLLCDTAGFLGPLARQSGLEIAIHNSIENIEIPADAQRLQQVFFNLAVNAFRAMHQGGTLTIRIGLATVSPKPTVQIDFADQGNGIDAVHLEQIFDPGFTTKAGSPGLGLSVCRKVIEQHGGSICVASSTQHGTTFSIFLPIFGGNE
jgi:two-component system sensor histidine kinase FlrB